ncbi:MAG: hypothetical protein AAFN93_24650 [Bacteroidota bacterium]
MSKQEADININIIIGIANTQNSVNSRVSNSLKDEIPDKLKVNASVANLAFIFKVLHDIKFIEVENVSELFRFITKTVRTENAENISFDSFKARFYTPSVATKRFFKDFILNQLNYVNKLLKE